MTRLNVTEMLILSLVDEVAPLVENATGWGLNIDSLRCRVLPKDRGFEEVVLGRMRGVGIDVDDDVPRGLIGRLVEYVIEGNVLGAYQPSTGELVIVRENVDDSNMDGLRVVVAHELVHRAQHVNRPELFERMDRVIRQVVDGCLRGRIGFAELRTRMDQVTPVMTLIESHAYYVQEVIREKHFPAAVIESHFNLATLLMRLFGGAKISRYTEGIPAVAEAASAGDVESLYANL